MRVGSGRAGVATLKAGTIRIVILIVPHDAEVSGSQEHQNERGEEQTPLFVAEQVQRSTVMGLLGGAGGRVVRCSTTSTAGARAFQ